jgi:hypothetical protein
MSHWQKDMLNALNNGDFFKAMDTLGRAGKMNDATQAWADWHTAESTYNAAIAAGADPTQSKDIFKQTTLQIITNHTHHTPGLGHLIGSVSSGLGHFVHDAVSEAGKISKFIKKIPMLSTLINTVVDIVPGVASVRAAIGGVIDAASDIIKVDDMLSAAKGLIPANAMDGFKAGVGLMSQKGIPPQVFTAIRGTLPPNEQQGFDMAVSIAVGKSKNNAPPGLTPVQQASYYATHGMANATPDMRAALMTPIAADPHAAQGAQVAVQQIQTRETFWHKVFKFLHLSK